jgi:hypothetical protein
MTEGYEQKSVVEQIEESSDQVKLRVSQAIARTGAPDAPAITEYLSSFKASKQLAQNQEEFSLHIKRIRENVDLSDDERLEAGRAASGPGAAATAFEWGCGEGRPRQGRRGALGQADTFRQAGDSGSELQPTKPGRAQPKMTAEREARCLRGHEGRAFALRLAPPEPSRGGGG